MQFIDRCGQLPQHETRRYGTRLVSQLLGTCDHHPAMNSVRGDDGEYGTADQIAIYQSGPGSHLQEGGAPGIAYTFVIEPDATIVWCWPLTVRPWSQGWADRPGDENRQFLSICHVGNFDSKHSRSGNRPTPEQFMAGLALHLHLTGSIKDPRIPDELFNAVPYGPGDRFGHRDFGKPACPGDDISIMAELAQHHATPQLKGDEAWQQALLDLGYKLPRWGADGDWGAESKTALVQFQRNAGIPVTGQRDRASERALVEALDERV